LLQGLDEPGLEVELAVALGHAIQRAPSGTPSSMAVVKAASGKVIVSTRVRQPSSRHTRAASPRPMARAARTPSNRSGPSARCACQMATMGQRELHTAVPGRSTSVAASADSPARRASPGTWAWPSASGSPGMGALAACTASAAASHW